MSKKERLDVLLVAQGLAESRQKAQAMILSGAVVVGDHRVDKPGTRVDVQAAIRVRGETLKYVSRGGLKLEAALDAFALDVRGFVAADIGASTGGFTDCLLQRGAVRVYAIDVGTAQLHEKLRQDPRVVSVERFNARELDATVVPESVDLAVFDVSFISLLKVVPAVLPRLKPEALVIALVKPQFEAGREAVEKGGVVRDEAVRSATITQVATALDGLGLTRVGLMDCPIPGPSGNVEGLYAGRLQPRSAR